MHEKKEAFGETQERHSCAGETESEGRKLTTVGVNERDISLEEIGELYGSLRLVNPRAEKQMEASMERYGQISPVVLCRSERTGYELVDGFKRFRASRSMGKELLRARTLELGARAAKAAVLCLNWVSRSVSDLEEGWVVHALCREDGLSQLEAGQLLGRSNSWVSRRLSLVERLCDEVQCQLRLGLITGTIGRELSRLPRGKQELMLKAVNEHGLGSREVSGLVELVRDSSAKEAEEILRAPRKVLSSLGKEVSVPRDPRLSKEGNLVLRELTVMERACARVTTTVGLQGLSRLRGGDLAALAPAFGQAERSGRRASQVLQEALAARARGRDDHVEQPRGA